MSKKHENYELLNLLGYGLAKFDNDFIKEFNCKSKQEFFNIFVKENIVKTASVVKNKMDLFDYFFPNKRRGWWQKGNAYIHRKELIDSLYGNLDVRNYANIVKLVLKNEYKITLDSKDFKPSAILESKFKKMQNTGLEAELYFMKNYNQIDILRDFNLEDARLYGDGYDFFMTNKESEFLCEIKGVKEKSGNVRLTQNEYQKASKFKDAYMLVVVLNLRENPQFREYINPLENLNFKEKILQQKITKEYHLDGIIS
ncbi:DUF3883 domain-containing protein [Helicobacter saguini]|uniref:DUF3883 domain-containing protein n=1 Tax=Helicobacter saguini TaxID=1548018 RepID=A0A347VSN7_9HELI|nr:DUF3883 domain-containing protein [Helicobacter saguini]MWV62425.1 DUF3883 domain-containing protein [Helicobacter saguini]MWV66903.1 DUF3883 domain-containing protein [Helicobacter saguini]MWV69252.1 DUF3883 domain-containing protein [Helicobacter saguini]MWV71193.1 DUF3883 domain-containing protein [Helicobacter saguini]TLD93327.1 DUF3883 domain-containing protein [Helicobacter saguini]